jgi:hypothetical protein
VEVEIRPEPSEEERTVIVEALEAAVPVSRTPPGYDSPWRAAGLRESTGHDESDP